MSKDGLDALRARVHEDPGLAARLHRLEAERFPGEVVRLAAELGLDVSDSDVGQAVARGRQAWNLRWIL